MTTVEREIAVRAFEHGFAIGADPTKRNTGRHVVDADTHSHWQAGYAAGRAAVEAAASAYRVRVQ